MDIFLLKKAKFVCKKSTGLPDLRSLLPTRAAWVKVGEIMAKQLSGWVQVKATIRDSSLYQLICLSMDLMNPVLVA